VARVRRQPVAAALTLRLREVGRARDRPDRGGGVGDGDPAGRGRRRHHRIENATGGPWPDTPRATDANGVVNILRGLAGDDTLLTREGTATVDVVDGGGGTGDRYAEDPSDTQTACEVALPCPRAAGVDSAGRGRGRWAKRPYAEGAMETYVILRRGAWKSPEELEQAAARSAQVGDEEMADDIRWIRSYVLEEGSGSVGTVCIYQATSEDKVREHAARAGLAADEVIRVVDTVLMRPDPEPTPS
jgi:uncharacterized protein DUF4242